MPAFTLNNAPFPDGTEVSAYDATGYSTFPAGGPPGSAAASAVVASGSLTFSGLADKTPYFAAAQVGGVWLNRRFVVGEDATAVPVETEDLSTGMLLARRRDETLNLVSSAEIARVVNAVEEGATGDGETDDTAELQAAIDKAIELERPLYLPPGEYKVTGGLKAVTSNFAMFGAGTRLSVIVASAATYDVLTIGPGVGGSGNSPSGYARDFGIDGGNAEWSKSGVESVTGKAAFKLDGMRHFCVDRVAILDDADFDIGFDFANNSHGSELRRCRTGLNSCRVGVNLRDSAGTGNDVCCFNCWLFGEVAAAHIAAQSNGFHFYGGQMTASWQAAANEDGRGVLILGKDYLTQEAKASAAVNLTFDGIDFENFPRCWLIRAFQEILPTFRNCSMNASAANPAIGFYKNSKVVKSHVLLDHNHIAGDYSGGESLVVLEETTGSDIWEERGSWGPYKDFAGETNAVWNPIMKRAEVANPVGWYEGPIQVLDGLNLRENAGNLQISADWGATWKTVTAV